MSWRITENKSKLKKYTYNKYILNSSFLAVHIATIKERSDGRFNWFIHPQKYFYPYKMEQGVSNSFSDAKKIITEKVDKNIGETQ